MRNQLQPARKFVVEYAVVVEAASPDDAKIEAGYQLEVESNRHQEFITEITELIDEPTRA